MARPLTKLLAHDCEFVWTNQCDISFQMLKDTLCSAPILKYPDTSKPYMLYTDASKYGWAGVLTQRHTSTVEWKRNHYGPSSIVYQWVVSWQPVKFGLHSQKNLMLFICPSRKLHFILQDMNITLRSDHRTAQKVPEKDDTQQHSK